MSEPFKLFRLQQIDFQLDQVIKRQSEIDAALNDQTELKRAEGELEASQHIMQTTQKDLKRAEEDVQAQQIKMEQNQSRMYGGKVTNPKELQDLQHEAEAFKRKLAKLEDAQLEHMETFEQAESDQNAALESLETVRARHEARNSDLMKEQSKLNVEFERFQGEREAGLAGIPPDDIRLYEKLRESRAGVAVAKVSDKSCSACGSELPQALAQAARSPNKINRCETCGRILYSG